MLASEIITEEWLVEVLDDSMEMDWTTADGAQAIMRALRAGLVRLPQTGGQIAHVASAGDMAQAVEVLAQAFERSGDDRSAKMVREAEANSKLRKGYCTPIHMEVALDALVNMRALEATFSYRPPSGDQGPVAVGQATQPAQIGDTDAGEVVKRPPVHREAEGVCLNHPVQAAWDSVNTLPAIAFSEQEADALAAALARPRAAVDQCGKCRGSGHVQRGDSGECDGCGGAGYHSPDTDSPRAAVGEREAQWTASLNEVAKIILRMIEQGSCADLWASDMLPALRRLALQSPPAKVEGQA